MGKPFDHREVKHYWDSFNRFEKYAVQLMMAEVVKDHIYMTARDKVREALQGLEGMGLEMHDKIYVQFKIGFVMNDLLAVVGAIRRRREGGSKVANQDDLSEWYADIQKRMRRSPRYWYECAKLWLGEWWWYLKNRNKTMEEIVAAQYPDLVHTLHWDEHPEDWDAGCFCAECRGYMANE